MTLQEYVEKAKAELDRFKENWLEENWKSPSAWPLDLEESEWEEQELSDRFDVW